MEGKTPEQVQAEEFEARYAQSETAKQTEGNPADSLAQAAALRRESRAQEEAPETEPCHICNSRILAGTIAEGTEYPLCEDCEHDASREGRAARAYLDTFRGPWGLKASTEDAVLSVLVQVYPHLGWESTGGGIERLRSHPLLREISDRVYEEHEGEGHGAREIAEALLPMLDEALLRDQCDYAAKLALDCDPVHGDPYFIAALIDEVLRVPDGPERSHVIRRANEGWSVESAQHEYAGGPAPDERPQRCPSCEHYYFDNGAGHICVEYDAANPCSVPGCGAPTVWVTIAAPGTGSGRSCKAGHYVGTCRELTPEEVR